MTCTSSINLGIYARVEAAGLYSRLSCVVDACISCRPIWDFASTPRRGTDSPLLGLDGRIGLSIIYPYLSRLRIIGCDVGGFGQGLLRLRVGQLSSTDYTGPTLRPLLGLLCKNQARILRGFVGVEPPSTPEKSTHKFLGLPFCCTLLSRMLLSMSWTSVTITVGVKIMYVPQNAWKCTILKEKIQRNFWRGGTAPSPDHTPTVEGIPPLWNPPIECRRYWNPSPKTIFLAIRVW